MKREVMAPSFTSVTTRIGTTNRFNWFILFVFVISLIIITIATLYDKGTLP
jgi:hypothetical protein